MITLDEVVRSVLSEEGRNTTHEYLRYLNIANRGLKQLTMDVVGDTQVTLLSVDNSTLRASLPTGFISHSFVGPSLSLVRRTLILSMKNSMPISLVVYLGPEVVRIQTDITSRRLIVRIMK